MQLLVVLNKQTMVLMRADTHQVKSLGGNAVMNFKYGQKAHKGMKLLNPFKWDTEGWHGEGDVVIYNP